MMLPLFHVEDCSALVEGFASIDVICVWLSLWFCALCDLHFN